MQRAVELLEQWVVAGRTESAPEAAARIGELVVTVLGEDTAVLRLLEEAADGTVTERTRLRAVLAIEDEAESNAPFAQRLTSILRAVDDGGGRISPVRQALTSLMGSVVAEAVIEDDVNVVEPLFFGRDDAEHDMADGLLRKGFLPTTAFVEVSSGRKNLIIGRKGSGKSAICMHLALGSPESGESCLITPDDAAGEELRRFALAGVTASTAKSLLWRYVFALHAARFLVRHAGDSGHHRRRPSSVAALDRFLRDNGELADEGLYHRVIRAGRGLMSSFSLEAFGVKVSINANGAPPGVRASNQLATIESGVRRAFDDLDCAAQHGPLLVLVDQLEQVWSEEAESEATVIGLLQAGKHAALTYGESLRCVFFLRSDIYDALDFDDADKFHSDEIRISWTTHQLHQLALTRASVALGRQLSPEELWGEVFPDTVKGEPTAHYLFARTLPRPRDAIQFLNQCRTTAFNNGNHRITESDVVTATLDFSLWKILDLSREYRVRFPFLGALLAVFRDTGYKQSRISTAKLFRPFQQDLRKRHGQYAQFFDPDAIIELLFSVGFLGVHRDDGYVYAGTAERTVQPYEDEFCIHPCFRPALSTTQPTAEPVHNVISGDTVGAVVQAAVIHGDIRYGQGISGRDVSLRLGGWPTGRTIGRQRAYNPFVGTRFGVLWPIVRVAYVAGFLVGTTTHTIDLLGGGYSWAPLPVAVFFTALVAIDPLTAVLVALGRSYGVTLAFTVIVLDLIANWYVNWPQLPGALLHPTWLLLNLFSLFVLVTWLPLRRRLVR